MDGLPPISTRCATRDYNCIKNGQGFEAIVRFRSLNITNNGTFFTDSNGLKMEKRIHNEFNGFNFKSMMHNNNVTENYYPVTSAIFIKSNDTQMTVMNDRPQGGSSLENGTIELMQNRRMQADDGRGTAHGLDEYDEEPLYAYSKKTHISGGLKTYNTYRLEIFKVGSRRSNS